MLGVLGLSEPAEPRRAVMSSTLAFRAIGTTRTMEVCRRDFRVATMAQP